ncbi:MAG: hypothetical protein ACOY9J_08670 [Pseudomonadota bacterium]
MTVRACVVIAITCNNRNHPASIPVSSTYSGIDKDDALKRALIVGWRERLEEVFGIPIFHHDCPRCARNTAQIPAVETH